MLPFNADNLQDDDRPAPPPPDSDDTDESGLEVAPTLSDDAVGALHDLTGHDDAPHPATEPTSDPGPRDDTGAAAPQASADGAGGGDDTD